MDDDSDYDESAPLRSPPSGGSTAAGSTTAPAAPAPTSYAASRAALGLGSSSSGGAAAGSSGVAAALGGGTISGAGAPPHPTGGGGSINSGTTLTAAHRAVFAEQNAVLDSLADSVTHLGHLAGAISVEIREQNRMMTDLESSVDSTTAGVRDATRRTQALVRRAGGPRWCCLLCTLSTILAILILIILFR